MSVRYDTDQQVSPLYDSAGHIIGCANPHLIEITYATNNLPSIVTSQHAKIQLTYIYDDLNQLSGKMNQLSGKIC